MTDDDGDRRSAAAGDDLARGGTIRQSTGLPDPRAEVRGDGTPEGRLLFHQVKDKLFGAPADSDPVRIGRFVVIKRIGQGGMGLIYAAYDDTLDRKVAVKLLRPERARSGTDGHGRLMREAQALARLSHPNIIHVYEVGAFEDQVYVAMEYVEGQTLDAWQANRDWREILELYVAAARGLAAAHDAGIVHRDFKAENVLVREEDRTVRVLDFGLARTEFEPGDTEVEELRRMAEHAVEVPLTHTGVIMGTPAYMAPEQHEGRKTDPRTDQFSFCVALWEALYGFRPFAGDTLQELRMNVLEGAVEPAPPFTDVPPSVLRSLLRGLSLDPDGRYPSMHALLSELDELNTPSRWPWLAGGAAMLAVAAGVGLWLSAAADREIRQEGLALRAAFERARVVEAEEELRRLRSRTVVEKWNEVVLSYAQANARESPTESLAALKHLVTDADGWLDAARTVASDAVRRGPIVRELEGMDPVAELAFSPGSLELAAVTQDGRIMLWDLQSGRYDFVEPGAEPTRTAKAPPEGSEAEMPRFQHVVYDRIGRLVASDDRGQLHRWTPPETVDIVDLGEIRITALASSDGGQFAVGDASGTIHVVDETSFQFQHVLKNHDGAVRGLHFGVGGNELASASEDGTVKLWDLSEGIHRTFVAGQSATHVRLLDEGRWLSARTGSGQVRVWATDDGRTVPNRGATGTLYDGSLGSGVMVLDDPELGLAVRYPDDLDPRPLDSRGESVFAVAVDPSGRWAAGSTTAGLALWRIGENEAGMRPGGEIPLVARRDGSISTMEFTPDGSLVWGTRFGVIRRWDPDGSSTELLDIGGAVNHIAIDDDGRWVAADDEEGRIRLVALDGREPPKVLPVIEYPSPGPIVWSPNGEVVVRLACARPVSCNVDMFPVDGSEPSRLAVSSQAREVRFSPDASSLVVEGDESFTFWHDGRDPAPIRWPSDARVDRRLAFDFTPDGDLRIATSDAIGSSNPLRLARLDVWQVGAHPDRVHALFTEPQLELIVPSDDRRSLLLRTTEGRNLLWRLQEDRFHMLPDDLGDVARMTVSSDGTSVMVISASNAEARVIDVESGHTRSLPPVYGLVAWSPDGSIAIAGRGARKWVDPTPADPAAFLAWLDSTTSVSIPVEAMLE
jgi:WD40 repeat protein/predicted Ser/Thr protein kinase